MLSMHIDNINDLAVVECEGRIVGSEAFRLREAVTSQTEARIVVLDLSEVYAIGGGGLGMLVYLQQWTRDHGIQFKLFNPSTSVRGRGGSVARQSPRWAQKDGLSKHTATESGSATLPFSPARERNFISRRGAVFQHSVFQ